MARLNLEFHETICRAGRSPLLLFFMHQVHDRVRRFADTTFVWGNRSAEALREHEQLVDAIELRDAELAHRIAHSHMARAMEIRIEMLGDRSAGRIPA
jgi:DNA-binding FadR family transcriptional regulator